MARRMVLICAVAVLSVGLVGCGIFSGHEEWGEHHAVALSSLPSAAQATVARLTASGTIKKLDRCERCEREHGMATYCLEASVGGKDVEYAIDSSGKVLSTETEALKNKPGQGDLQEKGEGHKGDHEEGEDSK